MSEPCLPDGQLVSEVLLKHIRLWYYLTKKYVRFPEYADEIVQEAFVRIYRYMREWDDENHLINYMKRTVLSCAADYIIKLRQRRHIRRELRFGFHADTYTPENFILDREAGEVFGQQVSCVMERLDRLPDKNREAIECVYLDGFTLASYARSRSIPITTAKSRIDSGLKTLRRNYRRQNARPN